MKVSLTEKVKLCLDDKQNKLMMDLAVTYAEACDNVSQIAFNNDPMMSQTELHKLCYEGIRNQFGLKSQFACSVSKTVHARYKTINEQLKNEYYKVKDDSNGKWLSFKKDIRWLENPVSFKRPQADLVHNRDWSWRNDMQKISVATMTGRIVVPFECRKDSRLFDNTWTQGTAKLVNDHGNWYLYISVTKEISESENIISVVGIDRGLVNITTAYDGNDASYESWNEISRIRSRYDRIRASLQSKGTKGAKRVLKRLSGRENGWMSDVNHQIAKALVTENTLYVLEDLSGVSFDDKNLGGSKQHRHELRSWSFYDLEQKLTYKAALAGSKVIKVNPMYTSQRCPCCGNIGKEARNHEKHEYHCQVCHGTWNDDEVGAINLRKMGLEYLNGNPSLIITK